MNKNLNLIEKCWLENRISLMSTKEIILFNGAIKDYEPQSTSEMINLALQLNCFEALYPARNSYELGLFISKYSKDEFSTFVHLSKKEIGTAYEKQHTGNFVFNTHNGQGAYVIKTSPIKTLYDSTNMKPLLIPDYYVRLHLSSPNCPEGVWVRLPDYAEITGFPDELAIALDVLNAASIKECSLLDVRCGLPGLGDINDQYNTNSLLKLIQDGNNMGYILDEQWQGIPYAMERFLAAIEYEGCHRLDMALVIGQNLGHYDFIPLYTFSGDYNNAELTLKME